MSWFSLLLLLEQPDVMVANYIDHSSLHLNSHLNQNLESLLLRVAENTKTDLQKHQVNSEQMKKNYRLANMLGDLRRDDKELCQGIEKK